MKLNVSPDNFLEHVAKWSGLAPIPLADTNISFINARIIMEAVHLGVFEALKDGAKSIDRIAALTHLNVHALRSFLGALTSAGYLKYTDTTFDLTSLSRKWLLKDAKQSLYDQLIFSDIMWDWMTQMRDFLKTGKGLQYHDTFTAEQWDSYQKGMFAIAKVNAQEVGRRTPVPPGATKMLDIGGSHGLFSAQICRRNPPLTSVILDLPPAIEKATSLLATLHMGETVQYKAGNALEEDLGIEAYDLVFISSLVHHFTREQNVALCKKIYDALKPGGYLVIQEFIRPETPKSADQVGAVLDVFFALTSTSGTWSIKEISGWQKEAGFLLKKPVKFITIPGTAQVVAQKPK
jgi:2-polyprenyl-3-methyl-5-hydroxy-6-metoxy-1,4-benzoquinol methylase